MVDAPRPFIRDSVRHARQRLLDGREKISQQHASGSPGIQVCARLTDLLDEIVLEIYEAAIDDLGNEGLRKKVALIPHGGYGRRDVAPFSDVDLLLLHHPSVSKEVTPLARRMVTDICDAGLSLGFSARTTGHACNYAKRDPVVFTSQAEARYLAGSVSLFSKFMRRFRRQTRHRTQNLILRLLESRRTERSQYGETIFLLEPNIKRSRGALRDIHLLRWVGFALLGECDPANLRLMASLSVDDERRLRAATEFLLRLRNELHFHAGRTYDVLYRGEQLRIAELWNYEPREGILPVERFMQDYFEHTRNVRDIVENFVASAQNQASWVKSIGGMITPRREGYLRIGPSHISASKRGLARLEGNAEEILHIMELANKLDKRIEHKTWRAIRDDVADRSEMEISSAAAHHFISLLSYTPRLGNLLRRLHELRVLEKLIVGMDHAFCLLQFNRYHKYTVDEHSIRAVERATEFLGDEGPLGRAYRSVKKRWLLHLALLAHDVGKGFPQDHSDVGKEFAARTAQKLKLPDREAETLQFLVHKHLLMSHLTFRRDTSDESVIVQFAREVASKERLKMLFVLTAADLAAVGPGVLNPWKIQILSDVYERTLRHLGSSDSEVMAEDGVNAKRLEVVQRMPFTDRDWARSQIERLPIAYVQDNPAEVIAEDLQALRTHPIEETVVTGRYLDKFKVSDYTALVDTHRVGGIFHRLTGALSSQGHEILSAQIHSLGGRRMLHRFHVTDHDHEAAPPESRVQRTCSVMRQSIENPTDQPPTFRRLWSDRGRTLEAEAPQLPTRVIIDNESSPDCSIIDVFAHDYTGLLYAISKTLFELNVTVTYAKIGTYLDQVVDVFYVTDVSGTKITDPARLDLIRERLMEAIASGTIKRTNEQRLPHGHET